MRNPGDNAAGRAPGRRQGPPARVSPPGERPGAGQKPPRGDAALFTPGYSDGRAPDHDPVPADGRYAQGSAAGKGPARGFPPAPGQPPPVYPPGPFSAWNRAPGPGGNGYDPSASDAWLPVDYTGPAGDSYPGPDDTGPGYVNTEPGYADTRPGYADTEPGYADTRPGYADTRPGYADTGTGYADTGTGYADTGPGYANPGRPGLPGPGLDDPGYGEPGPGSARAGAGLADTGYAGPGYPEADYTALAVSDPAADATSTQAWETTDHAPPASHWPDLGATDEGWPDADAHQDSALAATALSVGPARPAPPGPDQATPLLPGPDQAGPGEGAPDGWDDPRWPGMSEAAPFGPAGGTTPGPADYAVTGPGQRITTGPDQRAVTGPGQRITTGPSATRAPGGRGRGTRGRTRARGRKRPVRTLLVCVLALAVVAGATYLWFSQSHKASDDAAISQQTATSTRPSPTSPSPSPSPSLGPWGHIGSRALDPVPLTLAELFPAEFSAGGTSYTKTVQKAKTRCAATLMGSQLIAAVSQAGCTQALRASYLSADHKLMGTIGVLNLVTAAAAEKAGKAAGPAEFVAQLPAATGPTRNLTKGTGFEAAEVKGHYLVLVWVEFADLRAPRSPAQRTQLDSFISVLFQETANVSLATREVTGSPPPP